MSRTARQTSRRRGASTTAARPSVAYRPSVAAARRGRRQLAIWTAAIVATWLIGLPWLARQPAVEDRLHWLAERRINPSAMYYTELESLKPVLERLDAKRRR